MPTQGRFPPDPPTSRERGREDEIHCRRSSSRCPCGVIRSSYLTQHLELTQNLRVQSGADPKEMAHRSHAFVPCEADSGKIVSASAQLLKPGFSVLGTRPVELATIAGGEENSGHPLVSENFEDGHSFCRAKGKAFPNSDCRRMVAETNEMEGEILPHAQR